MSKASKVQRELERIARRYTTEYTVEITGGNHFKFTLRSSVVIITSSSPSDRRAIKNFEARIRRACQDAG